MKIIPALIIGASIVIGVWIYSSHTPFSMCMREDTWADVKVPHSVYCGRITAGGN